MQISNNNNNNIVNSTSCQHGVVMWLTMRIQGRSPGKVIFVFLSFIFTFNSFHFFPHMILQCLAYFSARSFAKHTHKKVNLL